MFNPNILRNDEKAVFALRSLFHGCGYRPYRMSKFEEYDLYSENKEFLPSEGIITFNDTSGRLLALKPDVTLSIIKNSKAASDGTEKFYYNENVYRISEASHCYEEIMQSGIECIGKISEKEVLEVSRLALESLALLGENYFLHLADIRLLEAVLDEYKVSRENRGAVLRALASKNTAKLSKVCSAEQFSALSLLSGSFASVSDSLKAIEKITASKGSREALDSFSRLCLGLSDAGCGDKIKVDFSIIGESGYYSGVVFKGFIDGISGRVLSGGRYDGLMARMGKKAGALGFAVYLDAMKGKDFVPAVGNDSLLNIALPKGRLGSSVYSMFERAGFDCPSIKVENRRLSFENKAKGLRFFWVKPTDVAVYVERGAADIGVVGKDILLEYEPDVFELSDLKLGKCKMAVAAKKDFSDDGSRPLRVATKFPNIAGKYYAGKCRDIDIIHLNGSIETAPILGLSDVIVDISQTGKTLAENNLSLFETVAQISARLISNKAAYSFKTERIEEIRRALSGQVGGQNA